MHRVVRFAVVRFAVVRFAVVKFAVPLVVLLALTLVAVSASALIRRHDVTDAALMEFAATFPAVVKVGGLADGTLIGPSWVLTAGHVAEGAARHDRSYVLIEGTRREFDAVYLHPKHGRPPGFDLALVRLSAPVEGVAPLAVLSAAEFGDAISEGRELVLVGHGEQGVGDSRHREEDGRRRAGTNRVWKLDEQAIVFFFDPPGSEQATSLEVIPGPGDSGGPALVQMPDGSYRVAAVSSAGASGRDGPGSYEAKDYFARFDTDDWLWRVLNGEVEPSAIAAERRPAGRDDSEESSHWREHPAGEQLSALLAAFDDESVDLRQFVADRFATGGAGAERRAAGLQQLRARFRGARVQAVLMQKADQVDVLVAAQEGELILGVRVDDEGRIVAIFDGRP